MDKKDIKEIIKELFKSGDIKVEIVEESEYSTEGVAVYVTIDGEQVNHSFVGLKNTEQKDY